MQIIADLQLHSKFSRAVSKEMTIPNIYNWAIRKGIHLVATGDWTHPLWIKEIEEYLEETGKGLLRKKKHGNAKKDESEPLFLLATEVSCIFSQKGKGRRVHTLIWVPTLDAARKINLALTKQGCNLMSDGRPIIGLSSIQLSELVFSVEEQSLIIPAHIWTPWFGGFGAMSGFDSLEEEFGKYANKIYAVETGLSSNPAMNWQIKELDNRTIVSFSDAHSGPKMGREATVFDVAVNQISELSYQHIYDAIRESREISDSRFKNDEITKQGKFSDMRRASHIEYTIEFYPEEGKYHYSGHRGCSIKRGPAETKKNGSICPVCGKELTQGVTQRVLKLAERTEKELDLRYRMQALGLKEIYSSKFPDRPGFIMMVPLIEIIAECIESSVTSKKAQKIYTQLIEKFGNEFTVLLYVSKEYLQTEAGNRISEGIEKARRGDIVIDPGYDGVFGTVRLWKDGEEKPSMDEKKKQLSLL